MVINVYGWVDILLFIPIVHPLLVNGVYLPLCLVAQRELFIFHVQLYSFQYYNHLLISQMCMIVVIVYWISCWVTLMGSGPSEVVTFYHSWMPDGDPGRRSRQMPTGTCSMTFNTYLKLLEWCASAVVHVKHLPCGPVAFDNVSIFLNCQFVGCLPTLFYCLVNMLHPSSLFVHNTCLCFLRICK